MAIGVEAVLVCVWRFLHFSIKTSSLCVQKHPFVSAILLFFYILYVFFNLFVFWFPFLVCIAVLFRVFWTSGGLAVLEDKRDEERNDQLPNKKSESAQDIVVIRDGCSLQKQKSRRTNVSRISKEGEAQAGKEQKAMPISTTSNNSLIGGTALIDKNTKSVMVESENNAFDHGESSTAKVSADENIQVLDEQHHSVLDSDLSDSHILSSDDSDEQTDKFEGGRMDREAAQEDRNKAVQWTDDDQRNLMDLGLSEIERNKRLESLIARRRARKLFKMQVEKGLIDLDTIIPGQIAPIFVARNTPMDFEKGSNDMDTPDSAPSILLPMQNPFDLPYDPLEEKPNLMADSFHQEFAAAHQKDMLFCRHESFSLGAASFPLDTRRKSLDGLGYSRFRKQSEPGAHDKHIERMLSGKHDDVIEALLSKVRESASDIDSTPPIAENGIESPIQTTNTVETKHEADRETQSVVDMQGMNKVQNRSEVRIEPHVSDDSNDESSSTSFSEEDEQNFNASTPGPSQNSVSKLRHVPPKPLNCSIPKSKNAKEPLYDSSPSANERSRFEERLFYSERGTCHTPTYSIASDLQVEVSEVGSPPLTVDGANSPTDRESLNLDGDFEREYIWAASSQSSRAEENEFKSREVRGLSEKDLADIRSPGNNKDAKDVTESSMPLQQPDELDDVCSLSSSITEIYGGSQAHSTSSDGKSYDEIRQVGEEVGNLKTCRLSNALLPEKQEETMKLTEKLVAHPSVNPQESSNPPDHTTKKVDAPAAGAIDNLKDEKKNTERDVGAQISNKQETVEEVSKLKEGIALESCKHFEGNSANPAERQTTFDTIQPIKYSKSSNYIEEDLKQVTKNDGNEEVDAKTTQGSKDEQGTTKSEASEIKQISGDSTASAVQQDSVTTDVAVSSISSSSPTSVLLENVQKDQASSSNSNPEKHIDAPKSEVGDKVKSNLSQEKPHDSTLRTSQNGLHSMEESTSDRLNTSASKKSQEPFKPPEKSTEKANIILEKPAEEIEKVSQKTTDAAAELEKPFEEIGNVSVSHKATEAATELKNAAKETGNMSQKVTDATLELKKLVEESESQKATPAIEEMKKSAEEIINVSHKATEAAAELIKPDEVIGNVSQKATEPTVEFKKPAAGIGSASQKATEHAAELKKPAEEVGHVSQKGTKVDAESEILGDKIRSIPEKAARAEVESKKPAEEIGSGSQKEKEPISELKKPAEKIGNTTQKEKDAGTELKKPGDEIGSVSTKETKTTAELTEPAEEIGSALQKATEASAELKKPSEENESVFLKVKEAPVELKKSSEEIGSVSQKAREATAEFKKPAERIETVSGKAIEATIELKKPVEEVGNVSRKDIGVSAKLDKLVEKIGNESQKAIEAVVEVKKSAEVIGIGSASEKATDVHAESKKTSEGNESRSQKATETLGEFKKSIEETESISQQPRKADPELKKPANEVGNLSPKTSEPTSESKKPTEKIDNVSGKTADTTSELKKSDEGFGNISENSTEEMKKAAEESRSVSQTAREAPIELKIPAEEIESVSHKAKDTLAELKRPAEEVGKVLEQSTEAAAELKKPAKEIENVSQKVSEPAAELKTSAEKTESVSGKASEPAAELKKPSEEIGNVSQKLTEVSADDKIGNIGQKATEAITEVKKPVDEIAHVSQKATETAPELKRPAEESGSVPQKPTEAAPELKQRTEATAESKEPVEETGSVSLRTTEAAPELKKPTEASVETKKPVEEIKT